MLIQLAKSRRINEVLMHRVEQSMDHQANAFSLFQTAIGLENQVRARTEELTQTLRCLEKSTAEMQRAMEVAEQANISKTHFLAAATHDLLQPLNAARLSNAVLREERETERQVTLSHQIDRSLGHIEDLLHSILDMSKLDAGIVKPEIEAVRASDIFDSIVDDFKPIAEAKGLDFRVRCGNAVMYTDPKLYRRIIQNLVSNAIRYTHSGGVLLTCHRIGGRVRMSVVDTGIGISPEQKGIIFNEFQRCATNDSDCELSLGLGLSIVQRLLSTLGHELTFQTKFGSGSSFSVYSSCAQSELYPLSISDKPTKPKSVYGLNDATVLLVDNDPAILKAMGDIIGRWGCKVLAAKSPSEAISSTQRNRAVPDIIVADYQLDNSETGLQCIRAIRERFKKEIPAMIISADSSDETAAILKEAGITKLSKPIRPARLRALMAHLLG